MAQRLSTGTLAGWPLRQCGFILESLGLALLILSILAFMELNRKFESDLDNEAIRRGQALTTVRNIANDYLVSYSTQLLALDAMTDPMTVETGPDTTVTVAQGGFPRIDELVILGMTPPNLSDLASGGGHYAIRIKKYPEGCLSPNCNLEGLVTIDRPYLNGGKVDYARLGIAAAAIGPDSAFSRDYDPTVLSGYGGKWSTDNPASGPSGQPAGILAARFGYGSSVLAGFYRRDGSLPLTGTMNANNHAINNVTTLTATGKIAAKNMITDLHEVGQACDADEENAFGSGAAGALVVCSAGQWRSAQNNPVAQGSRCVPDGATGTSISTGEALMCRGGNYIRLNSLVAKNVQIGRIDVRDGSVVAIPSCEPGGTPDNSILLKSTAIDMVFNPPMEAMDVTVSQIGANWVVGIQLIDPSHGRHSGNAYDLAAILNLECRY